MSDAGISSPTPWQKAHTSKQKSLLVLLRSLAIWLLKTLLFAIINSLWKIDNLSLANVERHRKRLSELKMIFSSVVVCETTGKGVRNRSTFLVLISPLPGLIRNEHYFGKYLNRPGVRAVIVRGLKSFNIFNKQSMTRRSYECPNLPGNLISSFVWLPIMNQHRHIRWNINLRSRVLHPGRRNETLNSDTEVSIL